MGRNVTLFSGYSQKENRTTNYCLLIMKMLYEENPKFLASVMSTLTNENIGNLIGVKFSQQEKKVNSIPDGLITQKSFSVYIETNNFDWFYDSQLSNHLHALSQESSELKILFALGYFENDVSDRFSKIRELCSTTYKNSIFFKAISFEDLIQALDSEDLKRYISKNISDAISDFRNYLDELNLLPTWMNYIDVINCAGLPDDVLLGNVYMCPTQGGSYSHSRCKYFGMYRNKKVEKVALIEAVVDVESDSDIFLKWKNVEQSDHCLWQNESVALRK